MPRGNVYDISVALGEQAVVYPGDPPYSRRLFQRFGLDNCESSALRMSAHCGTHVDFPAHILPGGDRLCAYAAGDFVLPAVVMEFPETMRINGAALEGSGLRPGDAALFKTGNSLTGRSLDPNHYREFACLTQDCAYRLRAMGVRLAGIDACSVEGAENPEYPVHNILLSSGILILEGLNLAEPPPGRYLLVCAPLNIPGAEGAPARALLFDGALCASLSEAFSPQAG